MPANRWCHSFQTVAGEQNAVLCSQHCHLHHPCLQLSCTRLCREGSEYKIRILEFELVRDSGFGGPKLLTCRPATVGMDVRRLCSGVEEPRQRRADGRIVGRAQSVKGWQEAALAVQCYGTCKGQMTG